MTKVVFVTLERDMKLDLIEDLQNMRNFVEQDGFPIDFKIQPEN